MPTYLKYENIFSSFRFKVGSGSAFFSPAGSSSVANYIESSSLAGGMYSFIPTQGYILCVSIKSHSSFVVLFFVSMALQQAKIVRISLRDEDPIFFFHGSGTGSAEKKFRIRPEIEMKKKIYSYFR